MGRPKGTKNGVRNLITLSCQRPGCSATYQRKPSHVAGSHYCSRACQNAPYATPICARCGKDFPYDHSHRRRYCSEECRGNRPLKTYLLKTWPPAPCTASREELEKLYLEQRLTTRAIGSLFGVGKGSVIRWLRNAGIERRAANSGLLNRGGLPPPTAEELHQLVHVEHLSFQQIAERWQVDSTAITYWLNKHGIPHPDVWVTRRKGLVPQLPTKEQLETLYAAGLSMEQIGQRFGVTKGVIRPLFEQYALEARPSGLQGGRRWLCLDGHQVRSSYEQQVDDWLFEHAIEHVYEPQIAFDLRSHADFLANGWYIEVWGMNGNSIYRERRDRKRTGYALHRIPLIEIGSHAFSGRDDLWKRKLATCLTRPLEASHQFSLGI